MKESKQIPDNDLSPIGNNKVQYNNLIKRLENILNNYNLFDLYKSLSLSLLIILLVANVFIIIEYIANGGVEFRTNLFFGLIISISALLLGLNFKNVLKLLKIKYSIDIYEIAKLVGELNNDIKDKLLNSIQLFKEYNNSNDNSNPNNKDYGISEDLVIAHLEDTYQRTSHIDFNQIIDKSKLKRIIPIFFFLTIITFASFFVDGYNSAFERLTNYNKSYIPSSPFEIINNNKDLVYVDKGSSVRLEFKSNGLSPNFIYVVAYNDNNDNNEKNIRKDNNSVKQSQIYKAKLINKNTYKFELSNVKENQRIYAYSNWYGEKLKTTETNVKLTEIPEIVELNGAVNFPAYTQSSSIKLDLNNANIAALRGSSTNINITTNYPIVKASLIMEQNKDLQNLTDIYDDLYNNQGKANSNNGNLEEKKSNSKMNLIDTTNIIKTIPMVIATKNQNSIQASVNFKIEKSCNYWIKVENSQGRQNLYPVKYSILAQEDSYPNISLIEPSKDLNIKENLSINIITDIDDDYGFKHLKLFYRLVESKYGDPFEKYESIDLPLEKNKTNQKVYFVWNLKLLSITPEDKYEYYIEVADNDSYAGYKKSTTNKYFVRMVSFEEALEISEINQKSLEKTIQETLNKTEELKKDIQELKKELLKNIDDRELTYDQKKKAESISKKQQEIQKNIQETEKKINESIEQMDENQVISEETLQKYMELQELLKEINNKELKKMTEQMQNMMKQMSPEEMKKALENAKFDEEMFKQSIERTKKYLEKLKLEQKVDAIQKLAEELAKRQDDLMEQTEKAKDEKSNKELSNKQDKLKDDIKSLEKQMDDLKKQLENADKITEDAFKEADENFKPEEMKSEMEKAKENIDQNNKKAAKQNQKNAKKKLDQLAQQMNKMKQELQNKLSKEIERQFNKSINDVIQLSKQQEKLNKDTQKMSSNSNSLNDAISEQGRITSALKNAFENTTKLAEQSMSMGSESIENMLKAINEMEKAQESLQDRRNSEGSKSQKQAMSSLNTAAKTLQESLKALQQEGNGSCENPGGSGEGSSGSSGGQGKPQGGGMSQKMQDMMAQQKMVQEAMQKMMQEGNQEGQGQGEGKGKSGAGKSFGQMSSQEKAEYGRLKGEQGKALKSMEELTKEQEKFKSTDPVKNNQMKQALEEMKDVMSDINSGNVDENTFKKQEKILSKMLEISRSENERDKEQKREAKSGKDYRQSFEEIIKDKEKMNEILKDLLKSYNLGYTKEYEKVIKLYMENLKNYQIKN